MSDYNVISEAGDLIYLVPLMLRSARNRQIVLRKIKEILYDRLTLEGANLAGSLAGSGEFLRTVLDPAPMNEIALTVRAMDASQAGFLHTPNIPVGQKDRALWRSVSPMRP
jgi:hypothetical protein